MRRIPLLILVVTSLSFGCSEREGPTGPPDGDGAGQNPLTISYVADDNLSGSALISPAGGGEVETSDSGGVHFMLSVPPGAVQQNLTITITPLSEFDISGTGASLCRDCGAGDPDCCRRGALFTPEGLVLDTTATLVIGFPGDEPLPFENSGSIIYFDSLGNTYDLLPTLADTIARTLTCSISHLSGYGSDDPNEARLQALFDYYAALAGASAGAAGFYAYVDQLENLYVTCLADGYSALAATIGDECSSLFSNHAAILIGNASDGPSRESIGDLVTCVSALDRASSLLADYAALFDATKSSVLETIDASARSLAEQGHSLCEQGNCSDGNAILAYVLSIAGTYIDDSAFYEQVSNWLEDCCTGIDVSISATRASLQSGVLDPVDASNMYSTITVTVSKKSGDALEGYPLDLTGIDPTGYPPTRWQRHYSGTTDNDGTWQHRIYYSDLGDSYRGCIASLQTTWTASVSYQNKSYTSNGLPIVFRRMSISTHFDYSYEYNVDYPQEHADFSAHGSGSGVGVPYSPPCSEDFCDGYIMREYSASYFADSSLHWTNKLIGHEQIPGCIARPVFESVTLPNGDRAKILSYIYVNDHSVLKDMIIESCGRSGGVTGCDTTNISLPTGNLFQCPVWPPTSDGADDQDALRMFPTQAGGFVPFLWDSTTAWMSASMTVTVGIEW